MKKIKTFILAFFCLIYSFYSNVYANENTVESDVLTFVKSFVDEPVVVSDAIPIIDNEYNFIGFSVSLKLHDNNFGYVNYEIDNANPITDFIINKNEISLYERLTGEEEHTSEDYIVKDGAGLYHVESNVELKESAYPNIGCLFSRRYIASSQVISRPKYTNKYNKSKSLLSEEYVESMSSRYACSVVAATEIMNQENLLKNGSLQVTFRTLWDDMKTTVVKNKNGITYGANSNFFICQGIKKYLSRMNISPSVVTTKSFPEFKFFKELIDSNCSGLLAFGVMLEDGTYSGHTVNVVGHCSVQLNGVIYNYIIVADGWNDDAPRYMAYEKIDFKDRLGIKIQR